MVTHGGLQLSRESFGMLKVTVTYGGGVGTVPAQGDGHPQLRGGRADSAVQVACYSGSVLTGAGLALPQGMWHRCLESRK